MDILLHFSEYKQPEIAMTCKRCRKVSNITEYYSNNYRFKLCFNCREYNKRYLCKYNEMKTRKTVD